MTDLHPPSTLPALEPTLPTVLEALGDVDFPITKRELMDDVRGRTVLFRGANADLAEIVRDVADDAFDSEEELRDALAATYGILDEETTVEPER